MFNAHVRGGLCIALTLAAVLPASAQVLQGSVLDADTHAAIDGATVRLFRGRNETITPVITDPQGQFVLGSDIPGRYTLTVERLGYATVRTRPFDLLLDDTLAVEILIAVEPITLDPLIVRSERRALVLDAHLESRGFYERQARYGRASGYGIFLERDQIRDLNAFRTSDIFRNMPRMRLVYAGGRRVEIQTMKGCAPAFYIDGTQYTLRDGETIDEVVLPAAISAVEVYPGNVQPVEYSGRVEPAQWSHGLCGSVVIWTG